MAMPDPSRAREADLLVSVLTAFLNPTAGAQPVKATEMSPDVWDALCGILEDATHEELECLAIDLALMVAADAKRSVAHTPADELEEQMQSYVETARRAVLNRP